MTFHARSIVEFGRLFNDVADRMARGEVEQTLTLIRNSFGADAALLSVECRKRSVPARYYVASAPEQGDAFAPAALLNASGAVQDPQGFNSVEASFIEPDVNCRYAMRLYRKCGAAPFDAEESALAEILMSQLGKSMEAASRIGNAEIERALYSDVLDRLQVGVLILDQSGRILRVSDRADTILSARDGVQLTGGKLCATLSAEDKKLQSAIRDVLSGEAKGVSGSGLSLSKTSTARKMGLIVRRIDGNDTPRGVGWPAVAIYIRDADMAPDLEAEMMRQIFDLTPAEAAVARRLTDGLSLEDTALALDISRNTARAHLRSIFSKSGIRRQTELVRLVLNSAVIL
jgi:DNA-binding CsgD family transcriptional regulator/PAS domain-containing protein